MPQVVPAAARMSEVSKPTMFMSMFPRSTAGGEPPTDVGRSRTRIWARFDEKVGSRRGRAPRIFLSGLSLLAYEGLECSFGFWFSFLD